MFEPRSRRPATSPRAIPAAAVELICTLRKDLAGAVYCFKLIAWFLTWGSYDFRSSGLVVLADRSPECHSPTDRQVQRDGGLVYRFKTRRALSNLRIHEFSYAAL